jgi:aspartyl-tRNA(Asn)/glutamyl-tRNA(Gln) amidotransferase subunit B
MRTKEEAADYRYFPEPDIPAFHINDDIIEKIEDIDFELPLKKRRRFSKEYNLSDYDSSILTSEIDLAHYFEKVLEKFDDGKAAANWIINELLNLMNEDGKEIKEIDVTPQKLASILKLIDQDKISGKIGKKLLKEVYKSGKKPEDIVDEKGWSQVSNSEELENIIKEVLEENNEAVERYRNGEEKLLGFFMGQVMKKTKGKANPKKTNQLLRKLLKNQ